ncbi:MAG: hypothetical protein WAL89_03080 [Candidatus Sulfotelmatobacter sp.]
MEKQRKDDRPAGDARLAQSSRAPRRLACGLENLLPDIDADHPLGSSSSHLYGIRSFATAEVDDNFPGNPGEEFVPH